MDQHSVMYIVYEINNVVKDPIVFLEDLDGIGMIEMLLPVGLFLVHPVQKKEKENEHKCTERLDTVDGPIGLQWGRSNDTLNYVQHPFRHNFQMMEI